MSRIVTPKPVSQCYNLLSRAQLITTIYLSPAHEARVLPLSLPVPLSFFYLPPSLVLPESTTTSSLPRSPPSCPRYRRRFLGKTVAAQQISTPPLQD